jgi:predicted O-methyltransferase YrrM
VSGFDEAWAAVDELEGWMSVGQARVLFDAARGLETGSIVEIGSHRGRSTILLALAAGAGVSIVAVDPFDDPRWGGGAESLDIFRENLQRAGVEDRVQIVRATSEEAARSWDGGDVSLVYIDGAHDRPSVLSDIDGWSSRLAEDGLLFVHDAFSSTGVTVAVLQRFLGRRGFSYLGAQRSLVMFRKSEPSAMTAAVSSARLLARLPYFARNLAVKVALRHGWHRVSRALGHKDEGAPY